MFSGGVVQTDPYIFTNGTVADAIEVNARFLPLYTLQDGGIDAANMNLAANFPWTGIHSFVAQQLRVKGAGAGVVKLQNANTANDRVFTFPDTGYDAVMATAAQIPPIGSIIGHWDNNGAVTPPLTHWAYCDGSVVSNPNSPYNDVTLPDMSNRYLVGFGTEGGGDIDTALWATAVVGNASHLVNLQHVHDMSHGHADTLAFDVPAHYHGKGDLQITGTTGEHYHLLSDDLDKYNNFAIGAGRDAPQLTGQSGTAWDGRTNADGGHAHPNSAFSGNVGNTGGSNGDAAFATTKSGSVTNFSGNTGNGGSTAQSIQPRSIRVRWIMRIV